MRGFWRVTVAVSCMLILCVALIPVGDAHAQWEPFIGEIRWVAFNFAPVGWATCEGQLLLISQNSALFDLLGTTYGGDGKTTFALPDLRGRAPIGQGQGTGLTTRGLGDRGGQETVMLTQDQLPPHTHAALASSSTATTKSPAGNVLATASGPGQRTTIYAPGPSNVTLGGSAIGTVGGGQPHENMPPFLTLTCIIALQGIFPSRP
jgi:microcystin-dependent protein